MLLYCAKTFAQKMPPEALELQQLFQQAADSSIIFYENSETVGHPPLFILSKKGDTLTAYTYKLPQQKMAYVEMPKEIRMKIYVSDVHHYQKAGEFTSFVFKPVALSKASLRKFWNELLKRDPWKLEDDSTLGQGCLGKDGKTDLGKTFIYDGGAYNLVVIDKFAIKRRFYYSPHHFQKWCPRPDRASVIKIREIFARYLKFK